MPTRKTTQPTTREQGFMAISTLGFLVVMAMIVAIAMMVAYTNRKNAMDSVRVSQAQYAAEAALEYAVYKIWHEVWNGQKATSALTYQTKLEGTAFKKASVGVPNTFNQTLDNGSTFDLTITRKGTSADSLDILFEVSATGKLTDGTLRILNQTFKITGATFRGFDYALLTNNVNCVFCHTTVQDLSAAAGNPSLLNPQTRVKVAALESMEIRPDWQQGPKDKHDWVDTVIAGSLYLRGSFKDKNGNNVWQDSQYSTLSLKSTFQNNDTAVTGTSTSTPNPVDCSVATNCIGKSNQNFYLNYPDQKKVQDNMGGKWPDGVLPDKFPSPIPDTNQNRIIDPTEWDTQVNLSESGNDTENPKGSITGGLITSLSASTPFSGSWPSSGNTPTLSSMTSMTNQNVILDGTSTPLTLNGTTYVNGDVIIRGQVKGDGKIVASGNVYVMGDVTYNCGASACDYSKPDTLPKFAMVAGGNLMVGDFITKRSGGDTLRNGREYTVTDVNDKGTYDPTTSTRCGSTSKSTIPCTDRMGFTMREAAIFNRNELGKALKDPNYIPRFYKMDATNPLFFWNSATGEGADTYDNDNTNFNGNVGLTVSGSSIFVNKSSTPRGTSLPVRTPSGTFNASPATLNGILKKAAITTLGSTKNWISNVDLKKLWVTSMECQKGYSGAAGSSSSCKPDRKPGALRTDGLLYSSNGIFSVARKTAWSNLQGQWDLRGAIAAADTGILVQGKDPQKVDDGSLKLLTETFPSTTGERGLQIYYDQRMRSYFNIKQDDTPVLERSNWKVGKS